MTRTQGTVLVACGMMAMPLLAQERLNQLAPPALPTPSVQSAPSGTATAPSNTVALTNSMEVLDDSRALGIGDRVSLRIVEDRKPPVELIVTDSGEMEVPLIGRVSAKGKSCKTLAYEVKRLLEKDYFYKCNVIIGLDAASQRSRGKIYLMGQIRGQGAMELPPDETLTVSRAILRAGGFADFANKRKVKLVRKKGTAQQETQIIDVLQILEKGKVDKDVALQPDDLVIVPERLINF